MQSSAQILLRICAILLLVYYWPETGFVWLSSHEKSESRTSIPGKSTEKKQRMLMEGIDLMEKPFLRQASFSDLPAISSLFASARAFMKASGNPDQWKDSRPDPALIEQDLEAGTMYVWQSEDGTIHGVFSLTAGEDPTYGVIEEGTWLNDRPYAAIHRVASDRSRPGFFEAVLAFSIREVQKAGILDLRMDTHADNQIMQHLLRKNGFVQCGIIYTDDGTKRLAFQKILDGLKTEI